jgi:hypothetical protein
MPSCDALLCVKESYSQLQAFIAAAFAGLVCWGLGLRGLYFLLGAALLWIPVLFVVVFWFRNFAPPLVRLAESPFDADSIVK